MDQEFEQFVKREKEYRRKVFISAAALMSLGAFFIQINWTIMGSVPLFVGVLFLIGLFHNGASKEAFLKQKGLDEKQNDELKSDAKFSKKREKIYTIDEILKIYQEENTRINNIQKKRLFNYQEEPQIEAVKTDFYQRISKIRRMKVEVKGIFKTEIKYSELSPPLQLNNNKRLSLNLRSNIPVYIVSFDSEKINDWCEKNRRFPFLTIRSLFYVEPKFFRGQEMNIDINYSTTGSYRINFYEYIDKKYLG